MVLTHSTSTPIQLEARSTMGERSDPFTFTETPSANEDEARHATQIKFSEGRIYDLLRWFDGPAPVD